jgi:hypothetical protein
MSKLVIIINNCARFNSPNVSAREKISGSPDLGNSIISEKVQVKMP